MATSPNRAMTMVTSATSARFLRLSFASADTR
jgi:hypothetical protein